MNKKLCSLICFMLILGAFVPVAFAGRPDKGTLEKIVFKRYAKPSRPGKPDKPDDDEGYYTLLRKGVEWKELPIEYVINPNNGDDLSTTFITDAISASAEEWDTYTSAELFGACSIDDNADWDDDAPDERNEFSFGDYPQENVIAVCIVWGYFEGPPGQRRIVEFDIMFDIDFTWGDANGNPTVMDLQNIATHELGHGVGLGDLYNSEASDETMYGYSWYGDVEKRTLHDGDKTGIQELYGYLT